MNTDAGSATGIDLSTLTRYDHLGALMVPNTFGDYLLIADVRDALARATPQHPRPTDDHLWDATLRDRDANAEWADKLAGAIAIHFGVDIGEHSNMNCPWTEALDAIESAPPPAAADAATPQHSVTEPAVGRDKLLATPFRERFADAYRSLSVAAFSSPFWNQSMEELLTAIDTEIDKRAAARTQPLASTAAEQPEHETIVQQGDNLVCTACGTTAASEQQAGADERALTMTSDECFVALSWLSACIGRIRMTPADGDLRTKLAAVCPNAARDIDAAVPDIATTAADQQGDTASECVYVSLQADSLDDWERYVFETCSKAQNIYDLHFRIGDQEWKGSLREVMAALQGAAQAQAGDVARERVRDAVAKALDGIYYCGRVWSAWGYGTMREDDFTPAAEVDHVLDELVDVAIAAMAAPATTGGGNV